MSKSKQRREAYKRLEHEHQQKMYKLGYRYENDRSSHIGLEHVRCSRAGYRFFKLGRKHGKAARLKRVSASIPKHRSWLQRFKHFIQRIRNYGQSQSQ